MRLISLLNLQFKLISQIFNLFRTSLAIRIWGVRIIVGLRAESTLGVWVALELNLLRFVSLFVFRGMGGVWGRCKYFLIQRIGSAVFLFSCVACRFLGRTFFLNLVVVSIIIKLAIAPFQFWIVNLVRRIEWEVFFYLSSVQKILPLFIIIEMGGEWLGLATIVGVVVRVIGALNRNYFKELLVYSSVLGLRWIVARGQLMLIYIFLGAYRISFYIISSIFSCSGKDSLSILTSTNLKFLTIRLVVFSLFSISGVPPFIGFYAKARIISSIIMAKEVVMVVALLWGAVVFVFLYLRMGLYWLSRETRLSIWRAPSIRGRAVVWQIMLLFPVIIIYLILRVKRFLKS